MPRYSIDLTQDEADQIKDLAKGEDRTLASMLRCLVRRQLQVGKLLENRVNQRQNEVVLLENSVETASNPQSPDPTPARARSFSGSKKEDKRRKKRDPQLADLVDAELIISDLNERAGTSFRPGAASHRKLIAARMREGATVDDFLEVNRKKAKEWKGNEEMETYLRPSTLYGPKFDQYLGQADAKPGQRSTIGMTDGEKRAARWARRKEPGYYERTE